MMLNNKLSLITKSILLAGVFVVAGCNDSDNSVDSGDLSASSKKTKNVILMITDGASDGAWDIATYWEHGEKANDVAPYNQLTTRYGMTTFARSNNSTPLEDCSQDKQENSYEKDKPWNETVIDYDVDENYNRMFEGYSYLNKNFTDSAAAGTALATGSKTYLGAIGVDACGSTLQNIAELVKESGRSSGIISSVNFNHATPASFGAHNTSRSSYADISEEMLSSGKIDLLMGPGHPEWDDSGNKLDTPNDYHITTNNLEALRKGSLAANSRNPWAFIENKSAFENLANNTSLYSLEQPLFGLVQAGSTLQQSRNCVSDVAFECPYVEQVPTLETMTKAAVNYLAQNDNGFFLMVEGGAVDWAAHANDTARIIEEQIDFNDSIQAVIDWVETNSSWDETLLIVTTDHGNSYVLGEQSDQVAYAKVENPGKGNMPVVKYYSGNHTNELVRLYAKGAGSDLFEQHIVDNDPNYALKYNNDGATGDYIDNTNVFDVMVEAISG